jgi:hypothetical protein
MVYLLKMVIFHGYVSHNQRVDLHNSFHGDGIDPPVDSCGDDDGRNISPYGDLMVC